MNEAIIVTSADGTITRINEATSRLLDYSGDELVGQNMDLIVDRKRAGHSNRIQGRAFRARLFCWQNRVNQYPFHIRVHLSVMTMGWPAIVSTPHKTLLNDARRSEESATWQE